MIKTKLNGNIAEIINGDQVVLNINLERNPNALELLNLLHQCGSLEIIEDVIDYGDKSKLQIAREQQGLTLEQVADRVGCTRQAISKIENKSSIPKLNLAIKIADTLNMDVRDLL